MAFLAPGCGSTVIPIYLCDATEAQPVRPQLVTIHGQLHCRILRLYKEQAKPWRNSMPRRLFLFAILSLLLAGCGRNAPDRFPARTMPLCCHCRAQATANICTSSQYGPSRLSITSKPLFLPKSRLSSTIKPSIYCGRSTMALERPRNRGVPGKKPSVFRNTTRTRRKVRNCAALSTRFR